MNAIMHIMNISALSFDTFLTSLTPVQYPMDFEQSEALFRRQLYYNSVLRANTHFKLSIEETIPYIAKFLQSIIFANFTNKANLQTLLSQKFIFKYNVGYSIITTHDVIVRWWNSKC